MGNVLGGAKQIIRYHRQHTLDSQAAVFGQNRKTRGFTLLEVLVALLILGMGLLGLAGMQIAAINGTGQARLRSLAAIEANNLAAAMHANPAYWRAISGTINTVVAASGNCAATNCSASQLASFDVRTWSSNVQQILPGASSGFACTRDASLGVVICTISLSWQEKNVSGYRNTASTLASAVSTASYVMAVQP